MQGMLKTGLSPSRLVLVVLLAVIMALPASAILAEHATSTPAGPAALSAAQLKAAPLVSASQSPASLLGPSTDLGAIAPSTPLYFTVSFDLTNPTGLASLIQEQENPGSPLYRHYLTQQQFDEQFAPSPQLDTEATSYFTSFGITSVATGSPLVLGFRAPASDVEAAFHSSINMYRTSDGTVQYTNSHPLSLPAPLAKFLSSVSGISSFPVMKPTFMAAPGANANPFGSADSSPAAPPAGTINQAVNWTTPAYLYAPDGSAEAFGGTPLQFLNPATMTVAYNATGLYALGDEGQGSTIAVVMGEGYNPSDLATFSNETFGNPTQLLSRLSAYPVAGASGNASAPGTSYQTGGLSFEYSIDLEYSSTMAPRAHIDAVYGLSLDTVSLVSDYAKVASLKPVPNVVTNSWGGSENEWWNLMGPSWQGAISMENEFEELAALGCTVLFSSADDAGYDSSSGVLSGSFPATSPYVTSVGGTRTTVGNASFDAFPPADYTVTTTVAEAANSEIGSGRFWFPNVTLNAVDVKTVTNESYWYTPDYTGAPASVPPYGGGGIGLSQWFTQPWWQHGLTVSDSGRRMAADIAAEADFNETVYFDSGWNFFWGGTSFACPTVAGEIALIDTYLNTTLGPTPGQHSYYTGLINPLLYNLANDKNITNPAFDQITYGVNPFALYATANGLGGWPGDQNWPVAATGVTTGWNLLTGWGVPNVGALAVDAGTLLHQTYYVAFANNSAALTAPAGTYTFTVQTIATPYVLAAGDPYELWFSSAGLAMGAPVETSGVTSGTGTFTFDATTAGFLEVYVDIGGHWSFQSTWFSPASLTGTGTLSISLAEGTPSSMMGGFDAFSIFYTGSFPWEYPAAGPDIPNTVIVQVTYTANTPGAVPVDVYNAQVLGQTSFTGYWDSPPIVANPEFNISLLAPSAYTSLTLTNLDGISYVPTWNVPVTETYWFNATYLGLSASMTYKVTPQNNVEGVGPIETLIADEYYGAPGYFGYSANNTVVAPAVVGEGSYLLPVSFTNWQGEPLVGATVDIAYPPVFGAPFLSYPIPGTTTTTNATGIAEFTMTASLSTLAEEIGFLAIQVYNSSYADAYLPTDNAAGLTPLWLDDSEGLLALFTPPASMSTTFYADDGAVVSNYVGTEGAGAAFYVSTPGGIFSQWNNISALSYALDTAAPTSVPLGNTGQSAYDWSVAFPTLTVGAHTFTVTFSDSQGFTFTNVQTFWVIGSGDLPAPTVAVTSPAANSYLAGDVSVSWTVNEAAAYLTSETLEVVQGTFTATYNVTGLSSWTVPAGELASGTVTFTVDATNALGQTGSSSVSAFVANVPPTAAITSPANGASFVAGVTVTVGFSWSGNYLSGESLVLTAPGTAPQTIPLTSTSYSITNVVTGEYKLTLNVSSASGASAKASLTFNVTAVVVPTPVTTSTGISTLEAGLIAVVLLIVGLVIGLLIGRSGRKSSGVSGASTSSPPQEWAEGAPPGAGGSPPYKET